MSIIHFLSVALEFVIFVLALKMAFEKKRYIGLGLAVTFGIYVFYDLARSLNWGLPREFLDAIFFVAALSAFLVVLVLGSKRG